MRHRPLFFRPALSLAALLAAGCSAAVLTSQSGDIASHHARWTSHGLARYAYDFRVTGYFISYAGHVIHLVVDGGVVTSATDVTTGQPAPGPAAQWPTVDSLFARASAAAAAGALHDISYDPALDYPTQFGTNGPPDASGTTFASGVHPLP